jgi:UDP-N-acetylglucosamine 2-epimerase
VHPRTEIQLKRFRLMDKVRSQRIMMIPPCTYVSTLRLIADSSMVLTDSGGIQQECFLLHTPCVTLRTATEWVETVNARVNFLASPTSTQVESTIRKVIGRLPEIRKRFSPKRKLFGEADASKRIVDIVRSNLVGAR